jgi:hypothetical protein
VIGVAQPGKERFLKERAAGIAELIDLGVAVCLVDVRGTGETRPGDGRGWQSRATAMSSAYLTFGETLLGARLRDLRSVLMCLRGRDDIDGSRVGLWGESFAPVNPADLVDPPLTAKLPHQAEPLGALLALFGALFEEDVRAATGRGGLIALASVLDGPFCYVPHGAIVPGALETGDLCDVAAALAPLPVRLEGLVDGRNRRAAQADIGTRWAQAREAYRDAPAELTVTAAVADDLPGWFAVKLKGRKTDDGSKVSQSEFPGERQERQDRQFPVQSLLEGKGTMAWHALAKSSSRVCSLQGRFCCRTVPASRRNPRRKAQRPRVQGHHQQRPE